MLNYDAVVVGGGPVGGRVASDIARAGFRVCLLERDCEIGHPVQCSGLVTQRTLDAAGVLPSTAANVLTSAAIHSPEGRIYEIGGDRPHAFLLDRREFDVHLVREAVEAGADLCLGSRVVDITRVGTTNRILVERSGKHSVIHSPLIIGTDGPRSIVARFLQLPDPSAFIRARGADVVLPRLAGRDRVLIFLGHRFAPGFFAWAIPFGGTRFRIGWASYSSHSNIPTLRHLLEDYPGVFGGIEVLSQTGGLIPVGARARTAAEGGMVVGDAAGQAKPTSGGGLYTGLRCARVCAETAVRALKNHDLGEGVLQEYDSAWRSEVGRELDRAKQLSVVYRRMTDNEIEAALKLLSIPGVRQVVDKYGDIDYPSRLAAAAVHVAPSLLGFVRGGCEWIFRAMAGSQARSSGSSSTPTLSTVERGDC